MIKYIFILLFIALQKQSTAQYLYKDSCSDFTLELEVKQPFTDRIRVMYNGCSGTVQGAGYISLENGRSVIHGMINRATELIIFTNVQRPAMDGKGTFRMIVEPGMNSISFSMIGDSIVHVKTSGSKAQSEYEAWTDAMQHLMLQEAKMIQLSAALPQMITQKDSLNYLLENGKIQGKIELIRELRRAYSLDFVRRHPDSYLSGLLLNRFKRSLELDTIVFYFKSLSIKVLKSDFGKELFVELSKRYTDTGFLKEFMDPVYYTYLRGVQSVYDLDLKAFNGDIVSMQMFKENYILLDFWGSWCKPCIANIPHLNNLIRDLKNYPFKVISISMDTDTGIWKSAVKRHNYPGFNVIDDNGILATYFNVLSAPQYILIDKTGRVIDSSAPHPDNPLLKEMLLQLINR